MSITQNEQVIFDTNLPSSRSLDKTDEDEAKLIRSLHEMKQKLSEIEIETSTAMIIKRYSSTWWTVISVVGILIITKLLLACLYLRAKRNRNERRENLEIIDIRNEIPNEHETQTEITSNGKYYPDSPIAYANIA